MTGIYKWTSPSGKIYIGQSKNLERRKKEFLLNPFKQEYNKWNTPIDKARRKYPDFTQWKYEIIIVCEPEQLDELEMKYIELYDSTNSRIGYNSTLGGDGAKGVPWGSPKQIEGAKNKDIRGENNPMYGKHHTQDVKDYISSINKGRKLTKEQKLQKSKPVIEYTKDGYMLKTWDSATDAAEFYGVNKACIGRVCMGKKKSTCEHLWKYYTTDNYLIGKLNNSLMDKGFLLRKAS